MLPAMKASRSRTSPRSVVQRRSGWWSARSAAASRATSAAERRSAAASTSSRAHSVSWARRDSPRISARMRSSRGSLLWSTYFIVAATAGWRSAIAACIACATAR